MTYVNISIPVPNFDKPVLLAKIIMDYEILRFLTQKIQQLFDPSQEIKSPVITKKMVDEFGDTEIVKRSTRSFLKTLSSFDIIEPITSARYLRLPRVTLDNNQIKFIIKLYSETFNIQQVDIKNFDKLIFAYYDIPDLKRVALAFHNKDWEFIRGFDRSLLLMKMPFPG